MTTVQQQEQQLEATVVLEEHDGSIVPVLQGGNAVAQLVSDMQAAGLEVLTPRPGTFVLYTKEYTEAEQLKRDSGLGFHRGFSIASLFLEFPQLRQFVEPGSVERMSPFLDNETLAALKPVAAAIPCEGGGGNYEKWDKYWAVDQPPPWEPGHPSSMVIDAFNKEPALRELSAKDGTLRKHAIELGCGGGQNAVWLAEQGFNVVAVDVVAEALRRAQELAVLHRVSEHVHFMQRDIFKLLDEPAASGQECLDGRFDFILDLQCFHVLRSLGEAKLVKIMFRLLRPGGHLLLITGNSNDPVERGPVRLSRADLEGAFRCTGFEMLWLRESNFDNTAAYLKHSPDPPLAWIALLQKVPS